jgi:hypothetical protein
MIREILLGVVILASLSGCASPAPETAEPEEEEEEALARTEFTDRIENFFEYSPLKAGKASQFLIHLTDLRDGAPVEAAEVRLTVRPSGSDHSVVQTTARVGKVTGIYVADVTPPQAGEHDIEFHIKNPKLDERMLLSNFKVE